MPFRNLLFLDAETWTHLKTLAGSELRSPRNFVQLLIRREWESHCGKPAEKNTSRPNPGVSPAIPTIYHIRQGK